jgi:hypothetical protein
VCLFSALLFVIELVRKVAAASDNDSMSSIGVLAYDNTLAHYHNWIVRRAVHLALHMLPNRSQVVHDDYY